MKHSGLDVPQERHDPKGHAEHVDGIVAVPTHVARTAAVLASFLLSLHCA